MPDNADTEAPDAGITSGRTVRRITTADRSRAILRALQAATRVRITPGQRQAVTNNVTINAKPGLAPEDVAKKVSSYFSGTTGPTYTGGITSVTVTTDEPPGKGLRLFYEFNDAMNHLIQRFGPTRVIDITRSWLAFYDKVTEVNTKMAPPPDPETGP